MIQDLFVFMFSSKAKVSEDKEEIIIFLTQLINQLTDKKNEWKKYKPKYVPRGGFYDPYKYQWGFSSAVRIPISDAINKQIQDYHYSLEYIMKRVRKIYIKACSRYISLGGFNSQVQLSQILLCHPVNFFRS